MNIYNYIWILPLSALITSILFSFLQCFINRFFKNKAYKIYFDGNKIKLKSNEKLINAARIAYVELANRKTNFKFNEFDSISEIFNSYYVIFKILRNVLKELSKYDQNEKKIYEKISIFLNKNLRFEISKHQKPYREWLKKIEKKMKKI